MKGKEQDPKRRGESGGKLKTDKLTGSDSFRLSLVGSAEEPRRAQHIRSQDGPAGAFLPLTAEATRGELVRRTAEGGGTDENFAGTRK